MNTETSCACSNDEAATTASETCTAELRAVRPEWHTREDGEDVILTVALPGVLKKDLEVSARENQVSLRAPRSLPAGTGVAYELSLRLPRDFDPASAKAALRNGVLALRFSRREEAKARRIEINS